MQITFWHNTIWYLALTLISLGVLAAAIIKSDYRKFTFAFWLSVLGFTYAIEAVLILVLNAYTYYAGFTADPLQDAVLGSYVSQLSVSAAAVLFCVLSLGGYWIFIFSAAFFLLDVLFSSLGIYEHHWYSSIYTLAGFIPLFWVIRIWYEKLYPGNVKSNIFNIKLLSRIPVKWARYIALFLGVFAGAGNSVITTLKLTGIRIFHIGIFTEVSKDHTAGALIYGPALALLIIVLYEWKRPWVYKAAALAAIFGLQWILYSAGFLYTAPGWFIPAALLDLSVYYAWTVIINRCLKQKRAEGALLCH